MKRNLLTSIAVLAAASLFWGCTQQTSSTAESNTPSPAPPQASLSSPATTAPQTPVVYTGTVQETMNTGGYTYVQVDTGTEKIWGAAPEFEVAVGDEVSVPATMPMQNYHSKTLDRTFEVVYFAGAIRPAGQGAPTAGATDTEAAMPSGHPGGQIAAQETEVDLTGITKVEGGQTVGELLADMSAFAGEEVAVRGKVVKFSPNIMGKNWLHVRDGSGEEGSNDLTVTTNAFAQVGDTVLVKGVAATDKDFGYGYHYAFIVEDAQVEVE